MYTCHCPVCRFKVTYPAKLEGIEELCPKCKHTFFLARTSEADEVREVEPEKVRSLPPPLPKRNRTLPAHPNPMIALFYRGVGKLDTGTVVGLIGAVICLLVVGSVAYNFISSRPTANVEQRLKEVMKGEVEGEIESVDLIRHSSERYSGIVETSHVRYEVNVQTDGRKLIYTYRPTMRFRH